MGANWGSGRQIGDLAGKLGIWQVQFIGDLVGILGVAIILGIWQVYWGSGRHIGDLAGILGI